MRPNIFVVILNWNGYLDTVACIESIQKSKITGFNLEVVLVDNASTNGSVEKIKEAFGEEISVIVNDTNLGFAEGNNVGIRYALENDANYICILNNDTEVSKDTFSHLLHSFESHTGAGIASPKMYFAKGHEFHKEKYQERDLGHVIWYAGGVIDWANMYGVNRGVDEVDSGQYDSDYLTDFASGACLFAKREVFEKIGVFNEKYFLYLEDTELCERAKKAGFEIWYLGKPFIWHKVSQGSAIGSNLNDYFIHRNRLAFGMQYASLRTKFALVRESIRFILGGRPWQRRGVLDFYLGKFGKGSWKN